MAYNREEFSCDTGGIDMNVKEKIVPAFTFGHLTFGECYRTENGTAIYMKVKSKYHTSVSIRSGHMFTHRSDYIIRPVKGIFVEGDAS